MIGPLRFAGGYGSGTKPMSLLVRGPRRQGSGPVCGSIVGVVPRGVTKSVRQVSEWLRQLASPLRTLDPRDTDYSDLQALREIVGNARVVCIGESTHGAREFLQLRDRLTRFLISEMGFSALVMESGFPEGLAVDAWIQGGAGELRRVAENGVTWGFGEHEEVQAQLAWLREQNEVRASKVHFYGMDVCATLISCKPAIEICLSRLEPQKGDAGLLALSDLGERFREAAARYAALSDAMRDRLSIQIAALVQRAAASGDELAQRCAECARATDEFIKGGRMFRPGWNPRDQLMADNVLWALKHHERIVVVGHNMHIYRGSFMGAPMLGGLLAPVLSTDLVVIGTTYAGGQVGRLLPAASGKPEDMTYAIEELAPPPEGTIDALMDAAGLPLFALDLRRVPKQRLAQCQAMLVHHDAIPADVGTGFDALIHVQRVTQVAGNPVPKFLR